jgi:hypothetical protein
LLDQCDGDPHREGRLRRRGEIRRLHPSACPVAEGERSARVIDAQQMDAGDAVRGIDLDGFHVDSVSRLTSSGPYTSVGNTMLRGTEP